MRWRDLGAWAVVAAGAGLAGCEAGFPAGEAPLAEFNWTDMGDQPKAKAQRGDLLGLLGAGDLAAPEGAIAVGEHPYRFRQDQADLAARGGANPLPRTAAALAKGREVYRNVCIVCHGEWAQGDGKVARLFPAPPSLTRRKVRDYTDARIFHVPMRGQGSMPSYAKQLEPDELWAVVHYIRELQARLPVAADDPRDAVPAAAPAAGAK